MDAREVWLGPYVKLQLMYDRRLVSALISASSSAAQEIKRLAGKQGLGAEVRKAQLTQIQTALHTILGQLFRQIGDLTQAGQQDAAAAALAAGWDWDSILLRNIYGDNSKEAAAMRRNLMAQAPRNIEALILRMRGGGLPLSQQVYKSQALTQGWITQAIENALGRGASWNELQRDVLRFINPNTPGGASYAAKRLARTEINAAYHAIAVQDSADKPWVKRMEWRLSKSHPQTDVCNAYALRVYEPDAVPAKPHPQCFCYVVPQLLSSREFVREWRSGKYDAYLARQYGTVAA